MIFVDANVPMYLVGADHSYKADAQRLLGQAATNRRRLVTDAEVLQEILHRYVAIRRRDAIQRAFDTLLGVVDDVFPIDRRAVERAKTIVMAYERLSARDAIHIATMQLHSVTEIMSFDAAFDDVPGLTRIGGPM